MAQGIEEFDDIIEQLKPLVKEPEFNQLLQQIAVDVSKPKQFLLKMELKRLARPCYQQIDLRGHVDGQCNRYEYDGTTHYLDDVAIEMFERQVRIFGSFTLGVYESVISTENNFRVMYQKEQEERKNQTTDDQSDSNAENASNSAVRSKDYQTQIVHFTHAPQRAEERMNFAIPIEVKRQNNEDIIRCVTIDISVSGVKIKLASKIDTKLNEHLGIRFVGLEKDYALEKREYIGYIIARIDRSGDEQRVSLKRDFKKTHPTFDTFLDKFITGNKRRYKVNMDNTLQAILQKGFEQYYIPHLSSIPVYINEIEGKLEPTYVLTNDVNKEAIFYWSDHNNRLRLSAVLNHERLSKLRDKGEHQQCSFLYCFNQVNGGKTFFYTALQEELDRHPKLRQTFLAYGSRKASWRVFKIQLTDMQPSQCHHPLSLPDTLSDGVRRQNQGPAPRLMSKLKNLRWLLLMTDVTSSASTLSYQQFKVLKEVLPKIKLFGHKPENKIKPVTLHRFKYQNLRKETRFLLRTPVKLDTPDLKLEGTTEDVSLSGIKLELSDIYTGQVGDQILVSYLKLQQMNKQVSLTKVDYEVMHISHDRNVLRLRMMQDDKEVKQFFEDLIKSNRNKLKTDGLLEDTPGLGEALRNIYSVNPLTTPIFIKKDRINYTPEAIGQEKDGANLHQLFSYQAKDNRYNLYPLFNAEPNQQDFIKEQLKNLRTHSKPVMVELLVSLAPEADTLQTALTSRFVHDMETRDEVREFIRSAMGAGKFFALTLFISRTGRPDTELLHYELSYINAYAVHRAKAIEELLWSINGVVDLLDITDEFMQRYGFLPEHIQTNRLALGSSAT